MATTPALSLLHLSRLARHFPFSSSPLLSPFARLIPKPSDLPFHRRLGLTRPFFTCNLSPRFSVSASSSPETKLLQGSIFQKHHLFSTTNASDSSNEGIEQIQKISVTFVDKDGEEKHIKVPLGMSMLEAAHENDIELEGACEASLACSTCHVILMDMDYYNKLEDPTDEENDMLDLAFGLTETSRLGCQVVASPELDGIRLAIPAATRNFAVDGYVPKPH